MNRPLVTIPIAAYKSRPDHLAAAVGSALAQTWREIEVCVYDDSPDESLRAVVEGFGDARVRYVHNAVQLGVARNYWAAFGAAKGEFIAVLNHDDVYERTFVEKLVAPLMDDPGLALAFCDHWVIEVDGQRLAGETERVSAVWGRARLKEGVIAPFFDLFMAGTIPMAMATVFRRGWLPAVLPENAGPAYDLWLTYLLCRGGRGAYFVPERLSHWRIHPSSLTSQGNADWLLGTAECWNAASRDPMLTAVQPALRRKAAASYAVCAVDAWRAGRGGACLRYGWRSLGRWPTVKGVAACLLPMAPRGLVGWVTGR